MPYAIRETDRARKAARARRRHHELSYRRFPHSFDTVLSRCSRVGTRSRHGTSTTVEVPLHLPGLELYMNFIHTAQSVCAKPRRQHVSQSTGRSQTQGEVLAPCL